MKAEDKIFDKNLNSFQIVLVSSHII